MRPRNLTPSHPKFSSRQTEQSSFILCLSGVHLTWLLSTARYCRLSVCNVLINEVIVSFLLSHGAID